MNAVLAIDCRNILAESIIWCDRTESLYWTDIEGLRLWRRRGKGETRSWPMPDRPGAVGLCSDPEKLIVGLGHTLAVFDLSSGHLHPLARLDSRQTTRINDAACDPFGCFVFGLQDLASTPRPIAGFYRLEHDLSVSRLDLPAAAIGNGIAFSPDGGKMYYCDSPTHTIRCCDYAANRPVRRDRLFVRLEDDETGLPDGAIVDSEGGLWTARFGASQIVRYDRKARRSAVIHVPSRQPSCVAFGGPRLQRLFITTTRTGRSSKELQGDPHAGGIFVAEPGPIGMPPARFLLP